MLPPDTGVFQVRAKSTLQAMMREIFLPVCARGEERVSPYEVWGRKGGEMLVYERTGMNRIS